MTAYFAAFVVAWRTHHRLQHIERGVAHRVAQFGDEPRGVGLRAAGFLHGVERSNHPRPPRFDSPGGERYRSC